MADPGLRSYLYSQAERSMQELVSKGAISPGGHAEIMKILASEQGGGQQMGYPGPYPGQPAGYQSYPGQAYPGQQVKSKSLTVFLTSVCLPLQADRLAL
jgi:hypothetical protein